MLETDVQQLGRQVVDALDDAFQALLDHDLASADAVVQRDLEVNRLRYAIEERATSGLVSTSSREAVTFLVATLYVASELERMGDHAEGIAKVALMRGSAPTIPVPAVVVEMANRVSRMVVESLDALARLDVALARRICEFDDEIDNVYDRAYSELISQMTSDRSLVPDATYMLWVTHNLERIADRATNICERVIYLRTGTVEELNVSKY